MPELREALMAALDEQANETKEEEKEPEIQATEEVKDEPGTGDEPEDRQEDSPSEQSVDATETKADSPKFLPPEEETTEGTEPKEGSGEETGERESIPGPVAWRAAAKQHWGELPSEVQQEVIRREKEMNQGLRDTADARRFHGEFEQAVQPYRPLMQAAGVDELTATKNLWQMAATLQVGNAQQKAQLVAQIINQNGVDLQTLDGILAGQTPAQGGNGADPGVAQMIQRELAPVKEFMGTISQAQQSRQQQTMDDAETEIETFASDPANLFFEDVREDMADMLEMAAQRGRQLSLKDAYDRAVAMRPDLADAVQQTQSRQVAAQTAASLQRKKRAASSVQGVPAQPSNAQPVDMRGQLAEAWDAHSGDRH